MRFEVPQFIDIEDKIFGPLTWRQFLYVGGGIGMSVVIFLTLPLAVFLIFGLPLALLSAALAFYPVNNRPFSFFLEAIYNYLRRQNLYLWKQESKIVHKANHGEAATQTNTPSTRKSIASLSRKLELQAIQKTD